MSEQVNLGGTPGENAERDAIHVAVIPCVAGEDLTPGERVWRNSDGEAESWQHPDRSIGVVDPFRRDDVGEGERFWLFLLPNTITGMRHHWQHPEFDPAEPPDAELRRPVGEEPTRDEVIAAMRKVAVNYAARGSDDGYPYGLFIEEQFGDEIWAMARGFDMHDDPGDFWGPVEKELGCPVPAQYRENVVFTCSC